MFEAGKDRDCFVGKLIRLSLLEVERMGILCVWSLATLFSIERIVLRVPKNM